MGTVTCCAQLTGGNLGQRIRTGAFPAPGKKQQLSPELQDFVGFLTWQFASPLDALSELQPDSGSVVEREAFQNMMAQLGFVGDGGAVFDLLDVHRSGALSVSELRSRVQAALTAVETGQPLLIGEAAGALSGRGRQKGTARKRGDGSERVPSAGPSARQKRRSEQLGAGSEKSRMSEASTRSSLHQAPPDVPEGGGKLSSKKSRDDLTKGGSEKGTAEDQRHGALQAVVIPAEESARSKRKPSKRRGSKASIPEAELPIPPVEAAANCDAAPAAATAQPPKDAAATGIVSEEVATPPGGAPVSVSAFESEVASVSMRMLPYQRMPYEWHDDRRPRSFIHKGQLFEIPALPLFELDPDVPKTQGKPQHKGWAKVKSKVLGGGLHVQGILIDSEQAALLDHGYDEN